MARMKRKRIIKSMWGEVGVASDDIMFVRERASWGSCGGGTSTNDLTLEEVAATALYGDEKGQTNKSRDWGFSGPDRTTAPATMNHMGSFLPPQRSSPLVSSREWLRRDNTNTGPGLRPSQPQNQTRPGSQHEGVPICAASRLRMRNTQPGIQMGYTSMPTTV